MIAAIGKAKMNPKIWCAIGAVVMVASSCSSYTVSR